jgi:error-prone DNA polymerase
VAVGDAHYHQASRQRLHDALTCVRHGVRLQDAGFKLFPNAGRCLQAPTDRAALFADWPEALANAEAAAATCRFSLAELRYQYPAEWVPPGLGSQQYLRQRVAEGAARRYPQGVPEGVQAQLEHELAVVGRLGYADYFLTIDDLVAFARGQGILCQGRGSAANSVLCWCLGLTSIDPVRMGLLFERFLSEERAEPPDIDVDFEHERREEVIQYLYRRYGRDRAAMVSAVISYRSRSAIADLSKALGAPAHAGRTLRDLDLADYGPQVAALGAELKGFPRHLSIHSGGFVLSHLPLTDLVPIEPARMEGRSIIQWDKYDLDYVGLMKVDVLALGMLTALRRALDMTGRQGLADIPAEDPATYAMIQQGDTVGVFQIESRAQMNMLGRLKPANFYDLVIEVAIVRPGPIVGKMVHPYLLRRRGDEPVAYEHPALERILGKTLGVPLFQEQVMRMAVELADFTPGQADELRRAIGAWRGDGRLDAIGGRLRAGLKARGLSDGFVERVFEQIKGFADYGFPESHAASFALLCYASSYLKRHHPAEFTCALINSQPMGFYAKHSLVDDAKRHGVTVRPVHPNDSAAHCQVRGGELRLGFNVVEGLGPAKAAALLQARAQRPFDSLDDFAVRSGLGPQLLQRLALGDAFACFGLQPRPALWRLLELHALAARAQGPQLGLWDLLGRAPAAPAAGDAGFTALGPYQAVAADYQAYGLSARAHPMQALRGLMKLPQARCADARCAPHNSAFTTSGLLIVRQRPGDGKVVFATLEDESGLLDLVLFMDVYERFRDAFLGHAFFRAGGVLQRDQDSVSLLLKDLKALDLEQALSVGSHDWR